MKNKLKLLRYAVVALMLFVMAVILSACASVPSSGVKSLEITSMPTKTEYYTNEEFITDGMVISAKYTNGDVVEITDYVLDAPILSNEKNEVYVYYGGHVLTLKLNVSPIEKLSLSALINRDDCADTVMLEALCVGMSEENTCILMDRENCEIAVLNGAPNDFKVGDFVNALADVETNDGVKTLTYSAKNKDNAVVSSGNSIQSSFPNPTRVEMWKLFTDVFSKNSTLPTEYSYVKFFKNQIFLCKDANGNPIIHMDRYAEDESDVKLNGKTVRIVGDYVKTEEFLALISENGVASFPGLALTGELGGIYLGNDENYYNVFVPSLEWSTLEVVKEEVPEEKPEVVLTENQKIVKEIAYAYYYRGNYIQYDQTLDRRNINPLPEFATSQNGVVLDCSSYVNAIYYAAFGIYVVDKAPKTLNYADYAEENLGNADVVGYWENGDYKTEEEIAACLKEIEDSLEVGDVIVYRRNVNTGHTLIYIGDGYFLHSTGSDYKQYSNPFLSYDYASDLEKSKGTVGLVNADDLFRNTTSSRYLFRKTSESYNNRIAVLRPLAREGIEATEYAKNRMTMQGVFIEKISSAGEKCAVTTGQFITYTIVLRNNSSTRANLVLTDSVPLGTTLIAKSDALTHNDGVISFDGYVAAGGEVRLIYTVRVDSAVSGFMIETDGDVNGVKLNKTTHTISGLTAETEALLVSNAFVMAAEDTVYEDYLDFVRELYSRVGIDVFEGKTVMNVISDLISASSNTYNKDSVYAKMLAPHMYGGIDLRPAYRTDSTMIRLLKQYNLSIGDVILAEYGSNSYAFVYVGNGLLLSLDMESGNCEISAIENDEYKNILSSFVSFDRYVVIRPSL